MPIAAAISRQRTAKRFIPQPPSFRGFRGSGIIIAGRADSNPENCPRLDTVSFNPVTMRGRRQQHIETMIPIICRGRVYNKATGVSYRSQQPQEASRYDLRGAAAKTFRRRDRQAMNGSPQASHLPQRVCEHCARQMTYVGKLPRVGGRPTLIIYRCTECSRAAAEEA
jgi:hypothetical protein